MGRRTLPNRRGILAVVMIRQDQKNVTTETWTNIGGVVMNPSQFGDSAGMVGRVIANLNGDAFDWRILEDGVEFDSGSHTPGAGWVTWGQRAEGTFSGGRNVYELELKLQAGGSSIKIKYCTLALIETV